jgi:hypothetical protein
MPHSIQCVHSSHTRTHVHMCARAYERAHARMHTCMCANARIGRTSRIEGHARACTHVRARLGTHTRICICSRIRIHIRIHIQMHPHLHPHSNASAPASASAFACKHTCAQAHMCACTRPRAHMHTASIQSSARRYALPRCTHSPLGIPAGRLDLFVKSIFGANRCKFNWGTCGAVWAWVLSQIWLLGAPGA